jgi:hypothetical protein
MKEVRVAHHEASLALNKIFMRINPNDRHKPQAEFSQQLEILRSLLNQEKYSEVLPLLTNLREKAKGVLKIEWKRVKKGEPTFRFSKWFALNFLVVGTIYGVYVLNKNSTISSVVATKEKAFPIPAIKQDSLVQKASVLGFPK